MLHINFKDLSGKGREGTASGKLPREGKRMPPNRWRVNWRFSRSVENRSKENASFLND